MNHIQSIGSRVLGIALLLWGTYYIVKWGCPQILQQQRAKSVVTSTGVNLGLYVLNDFAIRVVYGSDRFT